VLSKGADVNAKDDWDKTLLDYAKDEEIRELLISRGAKSGKDL